MLMNGLKASKESSASWETGFFFLFRADLLVALLLYTEESIPYSSVLGPIFEPKNTKLWGAPEKNGAFFLGRRTFEF